MIHGRSIAYPCAIKGCPTWTKLDRELKGDEFVVCTSCENAVFLTVLTKMTTAGFFPRETPREMARVLNAFRRQRKGVALGTRPTTVGN